MAVVSEGRRETQSLEMKINASKFASLWRREESLERERASSRGWNYYDSIVTFFSLSFSFFSKVLNSKFKNTKKLYIDAI